MALSTLPKIWRILIILTVTLTAFFAFCFAFIHITIALVIGMCIILIAEKFTSDFRRSAAKYKLSRWQKHIYGALLASFWTVVIVFLVINSGRELTAAMQEVPTDTHSLTLLYNNKIGPFTPEFLGYVTIDRVTVENIKALVGPTVKSIVSETAAFSAKAILIIPIMLFMYFSRRRAISEKIVDMVPETFRPAFVHAAKSIGRDLHEFFAARVLEGTVVGGFTCLGFYIAGVEGWLVLGTLAGFLNIVPYFGPILSALPPLFLALSLDGTAAALYVLLTIVIVQAIDEFYLKPFHIPSRVEVDTLLSIILILIGTQLFGIIGTIFALPVFLIYRVTLRETYRELVRLYGEKS